MLYCLFTLVPPLQVGGLSNEDLAGVFDEWNKGELDSFLIEITAQVRDARGRVVSHRADARPSGRRACCHGHHCHPCYPSILRRPL